MLLSNLLKGLSYEVVQGSVNININGLKYDSRMVETGDAFVCIEGYKIDAHSYISSAINNGCYCVISMKDVNTYDNNVTIIKVLDIREALAVASENFFGNPSSKLNLIGITGTNGKTTTSFMIKKILEEAGYKVGLIGTIANYIGDKKLLTHNTTPESLEISKLFYDMVNLGVSHCVMEVSSHSLYLKRVFGLNFSVGIFTNLTQDHLDFHKTFEDYFKAKCILFQNSNIKIINEDDEYGLRIMQMGFKHIVSYGFSENSDIYATNMEFTSRNSNFIIHYNGDLEKMSINLPGDYNIYNALAAAGACLMEGLKLKDIERGLKAIKNVPGRCETVSNNYKLPYEIILDYAHTPDGLINILKTARAFTKGKLIAVFGCGGDRDKTKRPIMGDIGTKFSDFAIITSDNPRSEEPEAIIADILTGVDSENYLVEVSRKEAIKKAMLMAQRDDVIVIAGKGHEDYQILKEGTIHFDEREIVDEIVKEIYK